jgi:hypothetical protein
MPCMNDRGFLTYLIVNREKPIEKNACFSEIRPIFALKRMLAVQHLCRVRSQDTVRQ